MGMRKTQKRKVRKRKTMKIYKGGEQVPYEEWLKADRARLEATKEAEVLRLKKEEEAKEAEALRLKKEEEAKEAEALRLRNEAYAKDRERYEVLRLKKEAAVMRDAAAVRAVERSVEGKISKCQTQNKCGCMMNVVKDDDNREELVKKEIDTMKEMVQKD